MRAALAARRDPAFVLIARTDALAVHGWDDVVRRCRAYHAAGADLVFVDGIQTVEDLRTYAQALREVPKMYNGMLLSIPDVAALGFQAMITGGTISVLCKAVTDAMQALKDTGLVSSSRMASREEVTAVLGLAHVSDVEQTYSAGAAQPVR